MSATFLTATMEAAEDAFANNAAFRAWCGATDAADAKASYIFSEDAVHGGENLPDAYVVISEIEDWVYNRSGEGSGSGNFLFESGSVNVTFQQVLADGVDWTAANRIAFKDFIGAQIAPFTTAYEGNGFRLLGISKVSFNDDGAYRLRVVFDDLDGRKGYMYVWSLDIGVR